MDEILDIFDEQMNWLGTATRQEVHRAGFWHQTFHCWVLQRTQAGDFFLLQRRHAAKDTNPNKLDVSCAGHLDAGEKPSDGTRELSEELGITVDFKGLHAVGVYQDSYTHGELRDNEFCHVFVLVREGDTLSGYSPALGEVSGLYLIRAQDLAALGRGEAGAVRISGYDVDDHGNKRDRTIDIRREDLVEREQAYYDLLFQHVDL